MTPLRHTRPVDVLELTDGGQSAEDIAARVVEFIRPATRTLDLALYDLRLPGPPGDAIAAELRAASARGVAIRILYNVDSGRPSEPCTRLRARGLTCSTPCRWMRERYQGSLI